MSKYRVGQFIRKNWLLIALGCGLILLYFWPLCIGQTVLFGDNFSLMVPGKIFASEWLAKGSIPLWNPYTFSGINFIGDVNQSLFYPSTLLFLVLHPSSALNSVLLLQVALGFFGMYLVARKLGYDKTISFLVAGVWGLSNQIAGALNNMATLQSLTLTPWVILCGLKLGRNEKYSAVLLALVIALQLIGGYPQHVLFALVVTVFLVLVDRWQVIINNWQSLWRLTLSFALAMLMAVLLSAFVWLPFIEVLKSSTRSTQSTQQASAGSMYPLEIVKAVSPFIFDNQQLGYRWGPVWNRQPTLVPFLGWIFFIFVFSIVVARKWKKIDTAYFSFVLCGLLFAAGQYFPMYRLTNLIPIIGSSRGPSTILAIVLVVLALWYGSLVQRNPLQPSAIRKWLIVIGVVGVISLVGVLVSTINFGHYWQLADGLLRGKLTSSPFHTVARDQILLFANSFSIFLLAVSSIIGLIALLKRKRTLFVIMVLLQVMVVSRSQFFFGPRGMYDIGSKLTPESAALGAMDVINFRVLTKHYSKPYADFGYYQESLSMRKPFTDSFIDAQEMTDYVRLAEIKAGATPNWNITQGIPTLHGYTTLVPYDYYQLVATTSAENVIDPGINVLPYLKIPSDITRSWSVKYYVVDTKLPNIGEDLSMFPVVAEGGAYKIYEFPDVLPRFRYENNKQVMMSEFVANPNEISFLAVNDYGPTKLIVADRYDPNWHVAVNGKEVQLENYQGMRRFSIPDGEFSVKMWYQPVWFYRGVVISGLTLLVIIGYLGVQYVRSRRSSS